MKEQKYRELVDKAMMLIIDDIDDADLLNAFSSWEKQFRALPNHKETIKTVKGIIGFYDYCQAENMQPAFIFSAIHDVIECCKNYTEPWFAPRLERFAKHTHNN